ncbi:hypothetical protein ACNKHL_03865 [Shigella flexneri]
MKHTGIALVLMYCPRAGGSRPNLGTSILVALSGLFVLFLSSRALAGV